MAHSTVSAPAGHAASVAPSDASLINADLAPTPLEQRTWGAWSYAALWMGIVHSAFGFSVLGGLLATGTSVWQALAIVTVANLIQLVLMGFTGRIGSRYGIPFPVWARASFGIRGANVPAMLRGIVAIGWFGVLSYLGATAINALLETVSGGWRALDAPIAGVATNLWLAMIVYWSLNFLVVRHGMETVRRFEVWAGPMVFVVMAPLVVWAFAHMDGFGPVFAGDTSKYSSTGDFILHGLPSGVALFISASWATLILNLPDLTRFARSNRSQLAGTMLGLPIATIVFYGMSAIVVSGAQATTGRMLWNPADVLVAIDIPIATVVGALLITIATMSANVAANLVSPAYDLTNLLPRHLTFRRSAAIAIVAAFAYMPWKLMEDPHTLFQVFGNVGAVIGPITGIMLADHYVLHRRRIVVPALYRRDSVYWGSGGFNVASLALLAVVTGFCLLGQVVDAIDWAYEYAWFVGIVGAFFGWLAIASLQRGATAVRAEEAGSVGVEATAVEQAQGAG